MFRPSYIICLFYSYSSLFVKCIQYNAYLNKISFNAIGFWSVSELSISIITKHDFQTVPGNAKNKLFEIIFL